MRQAAAVTAAALARLAPQDPEGPVGEGQSSQRRQHREGNQHRQHVEAAPFVLRAVPVVRVEILALLTCSGASRGLPVGGTPNAAAYVLMLVQVVLLTASDSTQLALHSTYHAHRCWQRGWPGAGTLRNVAEAGADQQNGFGRLQLRHSCGAPCRPAWRHGQRQGCGRLCPQLRGGGGGAARTQLFPDDPLGRACLASLLVPVRAVAHALRLVFCLLLFLCSGKHNCEGSAQFGQRAGRKGARTDDFCHLSDSWKRSATAAWSSVPSRYAHKRMHAHSSNEACTEKSTLSIQYHRAL
jgi:hypothetical protein